MKALSSSARVELVDYLTGGRISTAALGFFHEKGRFSCPKEKEARGWAAKVLAGIRRLFTEGDATVIAVAGGTTLSNAKKILSERDKIFNGMDMGFFPSVGRNSKRFWESAVSSIIRGEALPLDRQTSVDIRKILRVPDTLHGSTGLKASDIPRDSLKAFDPLKDAVVFSERAVKVVPENVPAFSLNGKKFGPYAGTETELPMYAGIFLLARGAASLAGKG
jgi:DNA primase small subunit